MKSKMAEHYPVSCKAVKVMEIILPQASPAKETGKQFTV